MNEEKSIYVFSNFWGTFKCNLMERVENTFYSNEDPIRRWISKDEDCEVLIEVSEYNNGYFEMELCFYNLDHQDIRTGLKRSIKECEDEMLICLNRLKNSLNKFFLQLEAK